MIQIEILLEKQYKNEKYKEIAINWCEENDLEYK